MSLSDDIDDAIETDVIYDARDKNNQNTQILGLDNSFNLIPEEEEKLQDLSKRYKFNRTEDTKNAKGKFKDAKRSQLDDPNTSRSGSKQTSRRSSHALKGAPLFTQEDLESIDLHLVLTHACLKIDYELNLDPGINTELSGSTGILVLLFRKRIIAANVGDSRAVLLKRAPETILELVPLCREQKPSVLKEKMRIERSGGVIRPFQSKILALIFLEVFEIFRFFSKFFIFSKIYHFLVAAQTFAGPLRVWKRDSNMPGLMMTRTFGDVMGHECGIITLPGNFGFEKNRVASLNLANIF